MATGTDTPPKPSSADPGGPPDGVVAECPLVTIVVHLREDTEGGATLSGINVTIDGPTRKTAATDAAGTVTFSGLPHGSYGISARADDFMPDPVTGSAAPPCGGKQEVTLVLSRAVVVEIKAKVGGTNGVRKATDKRADNVLRSSTSADESLSGNAPVILVRGCKTVKLEAVTNPPGRPVSWEVKPNENTDAPPTITPTDGGKKADLKTNVHGSFSVIARLGGKQVVWNVVFVWVKVDVASTAITLRDNKYADAGSGGGWTSFRSGEFTAGQYPWEFSVKVKVVGGGNSKLLGTNKVKLHCLHNGIADTLSATYAPGETATEVPRGGLPIRDSNGSGDPWMDHPTQITPNNTAFEREFWTGDSPAGAFPMRHRNTNTAITAITGVNGFRAAVASVSDDAPRALMVHARMDWTAHFTGTVNASGVYTPNGAHTTADATLTLISANTGGQDAGTAGFETFEPRFNGGTDTTWVP